MDRPATVICLVDSTEYRPASTAVTRCAIQMQVSVTTLLCLSAALIVLQGERRSLATLLRRVRHDNKLRLVARWPQGRVLRLTGSHTAPTITAREIVWLDRQLLNRRANRRTILALAGWARLRASEARLSQALLADMGTFPYAQTDRD